MSQLMPRLRAKALWITVALVLVGLAILGLWTQAAPMHQWLLSARAAGYLFELPSC